MLVSDLDNILPLDCLVVAQIRSEWADHTWYYDHGYVRYYNSSGKGLLREHQYVALTAYGIPDGYYVHHIDGNRLNNRADNLAVMTPTEHGNLHHQKKRIMVTCAVCRVEFGALPSRMVNRRPKYCSNACRGIADRKVERPSLDYLAVLIAEKNNFCELGRKFGVSDNAVRKWARIYGLL